MINKFLEWIVMGILYSVIDRGQEQVHLGNGSVWDGPRFFQFHSGKRLYIESATLTNGRIARHD